MAKTQPNIERRFLTQEFRVSEEGTPPTISGYAAVFDSSSEDIGWTEEIDSHAFDSVMSTNPDVRALFNHDANLILGRTTAGTLKLNIDARGLSYEIDPPDTQLARDLIVSMRRKDITGSSFGFITKRDQWTENPDGTVTRRILEFDELLDVSPVTYPAFTATSSGVRSLPESCPVELRSKLQKRGLGFGCSCPCEQCKAGACGLCSEPECNDPECASCKRQASRSSEHVRMEMRLALAKLSH
jgi:uncharacterized protein